MSTLLLRLAAPLQAWGTESRFNTRQTGTAPSKSAVIGLLAAALGRKRDADLRDLRALRFGVRTDQPGTLLRDYHMVHYLKKSKETADVTYRYYLSDAVFLVGLEGDDLCFLNALEEALKSPAYPLFLGRRSCPPTLPLALGIRELPLEAALRAESWQASENYRHCWLNRHLGESPSLPLMTDADGTGYGSTVVQDDPLSFDQRNRQHSFRAVEGKTPVTLKLEEKVTVPTEHDAFAEVEGS